MPGAFYALLLFSPFVRARKCSWRNRPGPLSVFKEYEMRMLPRGKRLAYISQHSLLEALENPQANVFQSYW